MTAVASRGRQALATAEQLKRGLGNSSSNTGGNLTSTKIESKDVMFIVLQKNTRSMNSSRIDDLFCDVQECKWDAIFGLDQVKQKYGRQAKFTSSCALEKKGEQTRCCNHSEQKVAKEMNWTKYISERVIATFITINRQRITLMSVYMPHSGYADQHIEKCMI